VSELAELLPYPGQGRCNDLVKAFGGSSPPSRTRFAPVA